MQQYLDLLRRIMTEGTVVQSGTVIKSTGHRPITRSIFAAQYRHDLSASFPAVTTKKLHFDSVVRELLWFLRGETNTKTLGLKIWDSWAGQNGRPEGECGPIYGKQWTRWEYVDETGKIKRLNQISGVVKALKAIAKDPFDRAQRRLIVSAWNPVDIPNMGLPPCHTIFQFLPENGRLNCHGFFRSIDMYLGFPFNIASYATLTYLIAAVCGFEPGVLATSITTAHLYDNQFAAVEEQLKRIPFLPPKLEINRDALSRCGDLSITAARRLLPSYFNLIGYQYHPEPLDKVEVAV